MSIKDILEKGKPFYFLFLLLVIASIFFALGQISSLESQHLPIKITSPNATSTATVMNALFPRVPLGEQANPPRQDLGKTAIQTGGQVIGSKTGKKYYFPWCGTVSRIKPENQVHFASAEEARSAGYLPAANCKGLK